MGVESIRAPELLFQPSMIGSSEAGIVETIDYVLKQFSTDEQLLLAQNVFLTGGCANLKGKLTVQQQPTAEFIFHFSCSLSTGLKERLNREMLQIRPFQSVYNVVVANNVNLNAWHGARDLANSAQFKDISITRNDYTEYGGEYLKEHYASNRYFPTPTALNEPNQATTDANNLDNNDSNMKMDDDIFIE